MTSEEPSHVYLLWHTHTSNDGKADEKLLGVYSSESRANERRASAMELPGFNSCPDGFEVVRYVVDRDEWDEGFATS